MNIIAWIAVGLIGGALAKLLMPGKDPGGILLTVLLGIGGAMLGGLLSVALGIGNGVDDFDIGTIFLAVLGAMLLLGAYRLVTAALKRLDAIVPPPLRLRGPFAYLVTIATVVPAPTFAEPSEQRVSRQAHYLIEPFTPNARSRLNQPNGRVPHTESARNKISWPNQSNATNETQKPIKPTHEEGVDRVLRRRDRAKKKRAWS
jgi:uncharacterized membrane protein YeaQ/YmgE (transglycosylase-associated protein family)